MSWFLVVIVFFVGTSIGSFVNVLISRSIQGSDWKRGRSRCDYCQKPLNWYDMIPLLSYAIYRGKSRCCKRRLSLAHVVVEMLFGVLLVWWLLVGFVFFQLTTVPWVILQPIFWLGIGILLFILMIADSLYGVILMPLIYLSVIWIYTYRVSLMIVGTYHIADLSSSLLSGALSFLFLGALRVITKGKGMGDGDPYLAFVMGSLNPGIYAVWGMLGAFVLGSVWGIGLMIVGGRSIKASIPFGPFLIVGGLVALLFSRF